MSPQEFRKARHPDEPLPVRPSMGTVVPER